MPDNTFTDNEYEYEYIEKKSFMNYIIGFVTRFFSIFTDPFGWKGKSYVEIIEEIDRNSKLVFLLMAVGIELIFLNALAIKLSFSFALLTDQDPSHQSWLTYAFAYGIELSAFLSAISQAFDKRRNYEMGKKESEKTGGKWGKFWSGLKDNIFIIIFVGVSAWGMFISGMWIYKNSEVKGKFPGLADIIPQSYVDYFSKYLTIDPIHFVTILFLIVGLSFVVLAITHFIAKFFFEVIEEKKSILKDVRTSNKISEPKETAIVSKKKAIQTSGKKKTTKKTQRKRVSKLEPIIEEKEIDHQIEEEKPKVVRRPLPKEESKEEKQDQSDNKIMIDALDNPNKIVLPRKD